jgi:flavin reductase (DIM6/NTAB) family NADH-FMN oxidoreductase RutF
MNKKEIDETFRKITNGVYIITTKCGNKVNGMTAAWVTRVSFKPPLVLVSIGKTRFSHELIKKSKVFAVNILKEGQIEIGKHFGFRSGKKVDKFATIPYETKLTGSPILKEIAGYLDCKVISSYEAGDHTIFLGEVIDAWADKKVKSLVYRKEDFFGS